MRYMLHLQVCIRADTGVLACQRKATGGMRPAVRLSAGEGASRKSRQPERAELRIASVFAAGALHAGGPGNAATV
jgi:hypothetical protein